MEVAPVMAGPGDEMAAPTAGRGHLRASHADREQMIDVLKAAFVQGRLTKDELDARAGQTFAARTYAELAALAADLPAGLSTAPPAERARARTRPPLGRVVAGAALIVPPPAMVAIALLTRNDLVGGAAALVVVFFFMAWMVAGAQMLANWHDKRSCGQLPPRPAHGGLAAESKRDGGIGNDLTRCEARSATRIRQLPGHRAIQGTWRSPLVLLSGRRPANLSAPA
jgi:hypothetical protein